MRRNCCHVSCASILKILNFLQAFFGVSIIIYSIWMLDQWNRHAPLEPPPPLASFSGSSADRVENHFHFVANILLRFIYSFMGVGILVCIVTIIGFIAAEAISGCCLCFYSILKTLLILLEAALVALVAIDHHWEKDLPDDPTGELDNIRAFIEENIDICKWVGIAVVAVQVLSLLFAMVLRAMVSTRKADVDEEEDYENPRGKAWVTLLSSQANQASVGSSKIGNWTSRMREKYGLNGDKTLH